jgi:hypothetical protein
MRAFFRVCIVNTRFCGRLVLGKPLFKGAILEKFSGQPQLFQIFLMEAAQLIPGSQTAHPGAEIVERNMT